MSDAAVNSKSVLLALAGDGSGVFAQRIQLLHRCNSRLWAFEDEVRDPKLPHTEVVRLKRAIDRENLARHAAIAALETYPAAQTDSIAGAARKVVAGSGGLPVGVQVASWPGRDEVALRVMRLIEARAAADGGLRF